MKRLCLVIALLVAARLSFAQDMQSTSADTQQPAAAATVRSEFHIRYVSVPNVYIDAGRDAGLTEGMQLVLKQDPTKSDKDPANAAVEQGIIAKLTVVSVATTSAVCEITAASRDLAPGDTVTLPDAEVVKMVEKNALGSTRQYPMVVSFSEGDPLDEEVRDAMPHPPLPEVNQFRGRLGFDTSIIQQLGQAPSTSRLYGMVVRLDYTRIFGTYWNLNGYWRGQLRNTSGASTQPTIQDLMNRTYLMSLTYLNPRSRYVAGIGRMYLPYASSLETVDGMYMGLQSRKHVMTSLFAGSTPDPTAWNYNPDRRIGGIYFNVHGGSYDSFHFSSTVGSGIELQKWVISRPFGFTENNFSFKRYFSLYHAMQVDQPVANPGSADVPTGLGRSLLSARVQVTSHIAIDVTHTYFRDVPTWDPSLVGTGLLDKYLYQGLNGGARIEFPRHITGYFSLGKSNSSGDSKDSLNRMFGASVSHIWKTGLQADMRYSKFDSSFAAGKYTTFTLSRSMLDNLNLNVQLGKYSYTSSLAANSSSDFVNVFFDTNLGARLFLESMFTAQRGGSLDYDQWTTTLGFRFDNRSNTRRQANVVQSH